MCLLIKSISTLSSGNWNSLEMWLWLPSSEVHLVRGRSSHSGFSAWLTLPQCGKMFRQFTVQIGLDERGCLFLFATCRVTGDPVQARQTWRFVGPSRVPGSAVGVVQAFSVSPKRLVSLPRWRLGQPGNTNRLEPFGTIPVLLQPHGPTGCLAGAPSPRAPRRTAPSSHDPCLLGVSYEMQGWPTENTEGAGPVPGVFCHTRANTSLSPWDPQSAPRALTNGAGLTSGQ